jgi:hypothetical protein
VQHGKPFVREEIVHCVSHERIIFRKKHAPLAAIWLCRRARLRHPFLLLAILFQHNQDCRPFI